MNSGRSTADRAATNSRRLRLVATVGVLVVAALAVSGATPASGATCTDVASTTVITEPGCYVLTSDVTNSTDSPYVEVQSSDIVLRGAGHTLDGDGSGEAVTIDGTYSNVTVRNLTVTDWDRGVYVRDASGVTVRDVTARSSKDGIELDSVTTAVVRNVTTADTGDYGVYVKTSPDAVVDGVDASGSGKSGLYVDGSTGARISDTVVTNTTEHAVVINGATDAIVTDTTVGTAASSFDGVHVEQSDNVTVRNVTARDNGRHGVYVADSLQNATVAESLATGNTNGFRIHHSDGLSLESSAARDNAQYGGWVSSATTEVRNGSFTNNSAGVYLDNHAHVVENNTLRGNADGIRLDGDGNTLTRNRITGNAQAGLHYLNGKNNLVADNLFNNSANTLFDADPDDSNRWNRTTAQAGPNVVGGPSVGGNAWLTPAGDGVSDRWNDSDDDGFLDAAYEVHGADDVDALPLNTVAALSATPTAVDHGTANLSATVTKTVVVESQATVNVSLNRTSIDGTNATDFTVSSDPTPVTVAPGNTASVDVTFDPSTTGAKTATLTGESDTAGVDNVTVALSGDAVDDTAPTAEAGSNRTVDEDTAVGFDATGSTDNVGIVSYDWEFGDGATATGATPSHTYATPGTYTTTVTVTDGAGHTDSDTLTVTVRDVTAPTADAGSDASVTAGTSVSFDGTGSTDNVGVDRYAWNFGDGATATGATPSHTYDATGKYTVELTVYDAAGNSDTDTATVTVESEPTATATATATATVTATSTSTATVTATRTPTATAPSSSDGESTPTASPTPVPIPTATPTQSPPTDDGTSETERIVIDGVRSGERTDVDLGADPPESAAVSLDSLSFVPARDGPVTMSVTASGDPLPGSPAFDRADNTSKLAHIRVDHSIANENVSDVRIRFTVGAERLAQTDADPDEIALYRHRNGSWNELPTTVIDETASGYVFEARSPGLSDFAAGAKQPQFVLRRADVAVQRIRIGGELRVQVRITNTGGADGIYRAALLLNETTLDTRELTVAANGTRMVLFREEVETPGRYRVYVNDVPAGSVLVESGDAKPERQPSGMGSSTSVFGQPALLAALGAISLLLVGAGLLRRRI